MSDEFRRGDRVERTDLAGWGPGTFDVEIEGDARVRFADGFVTAWVPVANLVPATGEADNRG